MEFDLDQRQASMSVGEFSNFSLGPHDSGVVNKAFGAPNSARNGIRN